jgi:anhydro-N-acetylmuramic acid kinase
MAFDTGVGNVLLNEWVLKHTGNFVDMDGKLALAGKANEEALKTYLADKFFAITPPKSLDRNDFNLDPLTGLSTEDGAATLTAFVAESVAMAEQHFPVPAKRWYVTGGGRHNPALMQAIAARVKNVKPVETLGWYGDALEAQAFAYLAVRSIKRLPLTLPTTTGAVRAVTGGAFYAA